jgi:hypothetical protein
LLKGSQSIRRREFKRFQLSIAQLSGWSACTDGIEGAAPTFPEIFHHGQFSHLIQNGRIGKFE